MNDSVYMKRCLELAMRGAYHVAPNPMVGCVIVHNGEVIGEGYHQQYGEPHAEVNAINSVFEKDALCDSTLYVSLEPCSHRGKTPPCADLIIRMGLKSVVGGMVEQNPQDSGRGIAMLRPAGIKVTVGVCQQKCEWLNRRFICFQTQKRPYVFLKWAQTADGYIDLMRHEAGNGPVRISNDLTKTINHEHRCTESAIMVATRTALLDNPHLTTNKWSGPNPLRVLLDKELKVPIHYQLFDKVAHTVVFNALVEKKDGNIQYIILDFNAPLVPQVLEALYHLNINSVIIEGGTQWLTAFIESEFWDECQIETSPLVLGSGVKAPKLLGTWIASEMVDKNVMSYYIK